MLSRIGYETLFFQAHKDVHYDNTHDFLVNNGFQRVLSADSFRKAKEDNAEWGIEDGDYYKILFEYLDRENIQKPQFISLATIANHMRFDYLPEEKRSLYRQPRSINEDYANSIHLSDKHLKIFFDELSKREYLENSLVIITGDHSFPVGGHGISHNEAGFYDESFRTPFLMLWKNRIIPQRINYAPFSQMDIAPSVLDLLNVDEMANTFEGVSIFSKDREKPVYLVQPYSGRYVAVVDYPLKLVKHLRSGKEYLFNLVEDPKEEINLADKSEADVIEKMRNKLSYVFLSQRLLESNNIYGGRGELPR
jgi:phosphoglycerol transferase MdoB-like AlkP superfamily enzyme